MTAPRRSRHSKKQGGHGRIGGMWAMEAMISRGKITRELSCTSKIAYSAGGVVAARRALRRKRKNVAIYHCRFCGGYHLTSMV